MKKLVLFTFLFVLFTFNYTYSLTLTLKDRIYTESADIKLQDIIVENLPKNLADIALGYTDKKAKIDSNFIMNKLYKLGIFDIIVNGNYSIIDIKNNNQEIIKKINYTVNKPLDILKNTLSKYIDNKQLELSIEVIKSTPEIDIESINDNFYWEIKKIQYGLKDFENKQVFTLQYNEKPYKIETLIHLKGFTYISNTPLKKGYLFDPDSFEQKYIDISIIDNFSELIFDINSIKKSEIVKNISSGEFLRYNHIKRITDVYKGTRLPIVYKNDNMELRMQGKALKSGFINENIEILTDRNRKERGIIKYNDGEYYVEIQ